MTIQDQDIVFSARGLSTERAGLCVDPNPLRQCEGDRFYRLKPSSADAFLGIAPTAFHVEVYANGIATIHQIEGLDVGLWKRIADAADTSMSEVFAEKWAWRGSDDSRNQVGATIDPIECAAQAARDRFGAEMLHDRRGSWWPCLRMPDGRVLGGRQGSSLINPFAPLLLEALGWRSSQNEMRVVEETTKFKEGKKVTPCGGCGCGWGSPRGLQVSVDGGVGEILPY